MIYLDHAATTPIADEAALAMKPFLGPQYGNPSSIHAAGRQVREAIDEARDIVAASIGAAYSEITFTSSGTEADNLAIVGAMLAASPSRRKLVVSRIEHHAILHSADFLLELGYETAFVESNSDGVVSPEALGEVVDESTALVSVMHANNETGVIQDVANLAKVAREAGALFHMDAVQSFGYLPINVAGIGCDLLSISAHKVYGPKGAGALYSRSGVPLKALIRGGAQERERRAGTENAAAIVGFGAAVRLLSAMREDAKAAVTSLRERFEALATEIIPGVTIVGTNSKRLPNIVTLIIAGVDGAALLMSLDRKGICASSGSACSSGSIEPSHVLKALGFSTNQASGGLRFSLGRATTWEELETTAYELRSIVERLRASRRD